jgi:uncharacterized membrane protein YgdD (TMEM256/DUF423 family)
MNIHQQQLFWVIGSLFALLSIAAGAFGSHLLKSKLSSDYLNVFEVAIRYQMYHALALVVIALLMNISHSPWLDKAGWSFIIGVFLFSGSLYTLVLFNIKQLGMVTPFGGLSLILGWFFLILAGLSK